MNGFNRTARLTGALALAIVAGFASDAFAQTKVRVGWCTSVLTTGVIPFGVATKMGWFKDQGITVELVNFPGTSDCVRNVATREVLAAVPSVEPVANLHLQGVKIKTFYTAYRRNIFGLAVPADSKINDYKDLKGKKIGVTSMASTGVLVARSVAATSGLDPDKDVRIVVSGQPAQTATLIKKGEVDAVSQWDVNYILIGRAGVPLRLLTDPEVASFPANSFVALDETIKNKPELLVALARAYTMGVLYAIQKPLQATKMFHEVYPQVVPQGLDPATAAIEQSELLETIVKSWVLEKPSEKWGESDLVVYQRYLDWLKKWGALKEAVSASDITTNELVAKINQIDLSAVEKAVASK